MTIPVRLGPPEHLGLVVPDIEAALGRFRALGHRFAPVTEPLARIRRPGGAVEETPLRYATSGGELPYVKLIQEVPESFWQQDRPGVPWHHVTYWADDLDEATARLVADGFVVEADGLEPDDRVRYRFLRTPEGARIELGLRVNRGAFEAWAGEAI